MAVHEFSFVVVFVLLSVF